MITQIQIPTQNKFYESYLFDGKPLTKLSSLSKINFFIGVNNSGKSRFIRALLKDFHSSSEGTSNGKDNLRNIKVGSKDELGLLELPYNDILPVLQATVEMINSGIKDALCPSTQF